MFTTDAIVVETDSATTNIIRSYPDLFDDALGTVLVPELVTIVTPGPIPIIAEYHIYGSTVGLADEDFLFEKILVNDVDAFLVRRYSGGVGILGRGDCFLEVLSSSDLQAEFDLNQGSKVTLSLYREHWWGGTQREF